MGCTSNKKTRLPINYKQNFLISPSAMFRFGTLNIFSALH
uniref:Uncharacterized protein n=1 Tax=Setaria italica TaxID=4555 RepID=K3Y0V3_SETIT